MGGLIGPALGGVLADAAGIRAPFTFTGAAAALAALYGLVRLPETRRTAQQADAGVVRNNAVPVTLSRTAAAQRVPEVAAAAAQSGITAETGNARLNDSTVSSAGCSYERLPTPPGLHPVVCTEGNAMTRGAMLLLPV